MFDITGFVRNLSFQSKYVDFEIIPDEEIDPQKELSSIAYQRLKKLEEDANVIAKEMGIDQEIKLFVNKDKIHDLSLKTSTKDLDSKTAAIFISELFFLVNLDDFPESIKPAGKNDPRFNSDDYFKEAACWVHTFLGVDYKIVNLSTEQKKNIKVYLMLLSNVELFPRAKDFVLRHELGHVLCGHHQEDDRNRQHFLKAGIGSVILGIGPYFFNVANRVGDMNLIVTFIALFVTHFVISNSFFQSRSVSQEYEADRIAGLKEREGGIYFFKTHHVHHLTEPGADDSNVN
ncbi:MAG TPA: M48 family metalloprotease, partial [Chlamydiales bacterium]|nr:M48 family metalloprotease [Chlamydiales bacterium]